MSTIHSVTRSQHHTVWDNSIKPVHKVPSGTTVKFDCLDASNGQVVASSEAETLTTLDFATLDQVNGPIFVEGAVPGDTLEIEVIKIKTADWGWTGVIPGFGLLSDVFTQPALKIYKLNTEEGYAWFNEEKGIKIPLRPFAGEMGVAPGKPGAHSTIPPYKTGGNLDTRYLTQGTKLYLPIEVEGALFSVGDGHAAQGDGEVCGTAIETPINIELKLTVLKNKPYVKTPHFLTPPSATTTTTSVAVPLSSAPNTQYYCTTGVEPSLQEATRSAVLHMIEFLEIEHGLSKVEAYMLCSVAGELRLMEVVDMPNFVVGMMMPKSIFVNEPSS